MDKGKIEHMLWVLTKYASVLQRGPYYLEHLKDTQLDVIMTGNLLNSLLFAAFRNFLAHPPLTQHILEEVMELCESEGNSSEVTKLYSRLLCNNDTLVQLKSNLT